MYFSSEIFKTKKKKIKNQGKPRQVDLTYHLRDHQEFEGKKNKCGFHKEDNRAEVKHGR